MSFKYRQECFHNKIADNYNVYYTWDSYNVAKKFDRLRNLLYSKEFYLHTYPIQWYEDLYYFWTLFTLQTII